ncbi:hypothetical protein C8Q77DRAFT_832750 [Trametes polyzona]|nr:hypothetical protein C8Q77DRAFT_832750 [Trametes polyzona]
MGRLHGEFVTSLRKSTSPSSLYRILWDHTTCAAVATYKRLLRVHLQWMLLCSVARCKRVIAALSHSFRRADPTRTVRTLHGLFMFSIKRLQACARTVSSLALSSSFPSSLAQGFLEMLPKVESLDSPEGSALNLQSPALERGDVSLAQYSDMARTVDVIYTTTATILTPPRPLSSTNPSGEIMAYNPYRGKWVGDPNALAEARRRLPELTLRFAIVFAEWQLKTGWDTNIPLQVTAGGHTQLASIYFLAPHPRLSTRILMEAIPTHPTHPRRLPMPHEITAHTLVLNGSFSWAYMRPAHLEFILRTFRSLSRLETLAFDGNFFTTAALLDLQRPLSSPKIIHSIAFANCDFCIPRVEFLCHPKPSTVWASLTSLSLTTTAENVEMATEHHQVVLQALSMLPGNQLEVLRYSLHSAAELWSGHLGDTLCGFTHLHSVDLMIRSHLRVELFVPHPLRPSKKTLRNILITYQISRFEAAISPSASLKHILLKSVPPAVSIGGQVGSKIERLPVR